MAFQKQITNFAVNVYTNNGISNVAFQYMPTNVNVSMGFVEWSPEYYDGQKTDTALSGKKRSRLAGYRLKGEFMWEQQSNSLNFFKVLDAIPQGVERKFWQGINTGFSGTTPILDASNGPYENDQFNGMYAYIGGDKRLITDTFSNGQIVLNASYFLPGTTAININAASNMVTYIDFIPNPAQVSNKALVVFDDMSYKAEIDMQISSYPSRFAFESQERYQNIPNFFKQQDV